MVSPRVVPLDGLFGCALPVDPAGSPLRPGGIQLSGELLDGAGVRAGQLVVDIGCGEGASVALMQSRGLIAVGVEASAATLSPMKSMVPMLSSTAISSIRPSPFSMRCTIWYIQCVPSRQGVHCPQDSSKKK